MRFLVDECTGLAVAHWLRAQKHEVFSVYEEARGMEINRPICGCNRKAGSFCSHVVMGACPTCACKPTASLDALASRRLMPLPLCRLRA